MRFASPLIPARLIRRYKRFLADVHLETGEEVTATVANTGAMTGLTTPGSRIYLSHAPSSHRKYDYRWEVSEIDVGQGPELVGVNTSHPNALVEEAIGAGLMSELTGYATLRREVKYGKNSRIDLLLSAEGRPSCYVEVKNVHLIRAAGLSEFPDCVTARGAKHLDEMAEMVRQGARAVMVYLIQYDGSDRFRLAADLDPAYARAFERAREAGVEAYAYACRVTPVEIAVTRQVPLIWP